MKLNLKKLVKNELLVPHLDAYQEAGKFPPVWNVEIRNYKEPDPHFHPSGDCFTNPVQLYMEKTGQVKRERPGYALRRIFDVGHMWHGYIQEIVKAMGFVEPHNVEKLVTFDYKMNGVSWMGKGSIDLFDVSIPNRGNYIVDIKTMNDEEFDNGPKEDTLKKWEAQLNCLSGDTLIQTDQGIFKASSLCGKKVNVLTIDGEYRPAVWFNAGNQHLFKVTLKNGDILYATREHEWFVTKAGHGKNLKKVTTEELTGEKILRSPGANNFVYQNEEDYKNGVRHGMVWGDGSIYTESRTGKLYTTLVQCKEDGKGTLREFFNKFQQVGDQMRVIQLPMEWKEVPDPEIVSPSYCRGFIAGAIASDGHVSKNQITICQSSKEDLEKIRKVAAAANLVTTPPVIISKKGTTKYIKGKLVSHNEDSLRITISKNSAFLRGKVDFKLILNTEHRKNALEFKNNQRFSTVEVVKVEETYLYVPVYCCMEPETHSFIIESGYVTGNCYYHWSGLHQGFILAVRKGGTRQKNGKPANEFREINIEYKPQLLDEIYERWTQAQKYIAGIEKVPT